MKLDDVKIRHEVIDFIEKNPHCRSGHLVDHVVSKKIASQKIIYKTLSDMVNNNDITKDPKSRAEIYYDIPEMIENQDRWITKMLDTLDNLNKDMLKLKTNHNTSSANLKNLKSLLVIIRELQTVELMSRLFNNPKALKKRKSWKKIEKSIDTLWKLIEEYVDSQGSQFAKEIWWNSRRHTKFKSVDQSKRH